MNRFATTAIVAAFAAFGAVAANAADLRSDATLVPAASTAAATHSNDAVRAGNVYSARELLVAGLSDSDIVNFEARNQSAVRAGDVYSSRELTVSGLSPDDLVTVSNFADGTQNPTNHAQHGWRADR